MPIIIEAAVLIYIYCRAEYEPLEEEALQQSLWKSILTDVHFWVPFVVLLIGLLILISIR